MGALQHLAQLSQPPHHGGPLLALSQMRAMMTAMRAADAAADTTTSTATEFQKSRRSHSCEFDRLRGQNPLPGLVMLLDMARVIAQTRVSRQPRPQDNATWDKLGGSEWGCVTRGQ
jgi:hypothetical protein